MDKTKKVLAIIATTITLIGAILGSGAVIDFSTSTIISDDTTTTINEGDTILGIDKGDIIDIGKGIACDLEPELCD